MTGMGVDLSVVIPVYNEVDNIEPLVAALDKALEGLNWEALFVDDNSPDGTANKVRQLAQHHPKIRLILRVRDRGLAKSAIQGMLSSHGEIICVMDGDGQHNPAVIKDLIATLEAGEADISIAVRKLDEDQISDAMTKHRQVLSKTGNYLCSAIIGRELSDPLTGFFAIRRSSFIAIAADLRDAGFKILLDILSVGRSMTVRELPFSFEERQYGASKLDFFVLWKMLTFLLSRMTGGVIPAGFISYAAVGASGVVSHLIFLFLMLENGVGFSMAQFGAAMFASSTNFLLNNILTFRDRRLGGAKFLIGLMKFYLVGSVGILANVSVATFAFNNLVDVAIIAAFAGIFIDVVWKYTVSNRLIW